MQAAFTIWLSWRAFLAASRAHAGVDLRTG